MHHLRSGSGREWADFPAQAEGSELTLSFQSSSNPAERTLRLRHRDLRQRWLVRLNGKELAQLPVDEADAITHLAVPAGAVRDGANELRVHTTATATDDVLIGEVTLVDRPRREVLTAASLDVSVLDEGSGRPVPGRITIADRHGTLVSIGTVSGPGLAIRPGVVYSRGGTVRLQLPAGRYTVYAGRGFEYSVATADVDLAAGGAAVRRLTIRREVDTTGWAAMDTHLHTGTFARHGDATADERMLTIAGEGVELPVSTEHNTLVDFESHARQAGVRQHFTPIVGSEVTTPALGHFNVFPIPPAGPPIDYRATDWTELRAGITRAAGEPVIVLNHGRDLHGGFRPLGRARHLSLAGEDLEGWRLPANAMEVVNSGAVMTDALALPRDWMGFLNRGVLLTPVGSSDSHDVSRYIAGQGRTYVRVDDRTPGAIDVAQAVARVRGGQVLVSYGLLVELEIEGGGPGALVAPAGGLDARIRVKGPGWTRAQRVALYVNGVKRREEEIRDGSRAGLKWEGTWRLPRPSHDVHLAALVTGPGIAAPYWPTAKPYQPTSIAFTPYVLGLSGAVFVDADASGAFESAFDYARRALAAARSARALASTLEAYDTAVAAQAASLLRAGDPDGFEARIRELLPQAAPHVAQGLREYLQEWRSRPVP